MDDPTTRYPLGMLPDYRAAKAAVSLNEHLDWHNRNIKGEKIAEDENSYDK